MLPLGLLSTGEEAEIVDVFSQGESAIRKDNREATGRIEDIGIRRGKTVEILNNEGRGPLLLKMDESRIAMARGMAMKIMVRRTK